MAQLEVPAPDGTGGDAASQAWAFLEKNADLFNLTRLDNELTSRRVTVADDGKSVFSFERRVNGIRVYGSDITIHVADGIVTYINYAVPVDLAVSTTPTLTGEQAIHAAIQHLGIASTPARVEQQLELVIFNRGLITGEELPSALAWRMVVDAPPVSGLMIVLVNAHTGEILYEVDALQTALKRQVFDAKGAEAESEEEYQQVVNNRVRLLQEGATAEEINQDAEAGKLYEHLATVYAYFQARFGRDSYDNSGAQLDAYVRLGSGLLGLGKNAIWHPGEGIRSFFFSDGYAVLDVVTHEFTHAVIGATAGLEYAFQPGALNESFADVFATFVDSDDWWIGDEVVVLPGGMRNLAEPNHWQLYLGPRSPQPDHMNDFKSLTAKEDSGGVHLNSGIPNHAAYLIIEGGTHRTSDVTVTGIGRQKAEQIYYLALTQYVGPTHQFADARNALLFACRDLARRDRQHFDITFEDCGSVVNGFAAVGIGAIDTDRDSWDDKLDNCPTVSNPDQRDLGDECGTGTPRQPSTPYRVTGVVFIDSNRDGTLDRAEAGRGGVRVSLAGEPSASANTDGAGRFELGVSEPGLYSVTISVPEGFVATTLNPLGLAVSLPTATANFGIVSITPVPTATPRIIKPGGVWVSPERDAATITGSTLPLRVRAYPSNPDEPLIESVNFTLWWAGLGPRSGPWKVACTVKTPISGDTYACDADLKALGVPAGEVLISFDVSDKASNKNEAPHGLRTVIYQPPVSEIAYVSSEGDVWIRDINGTSTRKIITGPVKAPAWSPDGTRIAYVRTVRVGSAGREGNRIEVAKADGTNQEVVVSPIPNQFVSSRYGQEAYTEIRAIRWSPDGNAIYYNWYVGAIRGGVGVTRYNLQTREDDGGFGPSSAFDIARDGSVAFVDREDLHLVDANQQELVITLPYVSVSDPSWSPDGKELAMIIDGELLVLNRKGQKVRSLASNVSGDVLTWSPDGTTIAYGISQAARTYGASQDEDSPAIWTVPVAGGTPTKLVDGIEPAWRPTPGRQSLSPAPGPALFSRPASPANVEAEFGASGRALSVGWIDQSDNEDGFNLYYRQSSSGWTKHMVVAANSEGITLNAETSPPGIGPGIDGWCLGISAFNSGGESAIAEHCRSTQSSTPVYTVQIGYATAEDAAVAGAAAFCGGCEITPPEERRDVRNASVILVGVRFGTGSSFPVHVYVFEAEGRWHYLNATSARGGWPVGRNYAGTLEIAGGCVNVRLTPDVTRTIVHCLSDGTEIEIDDGPVYATGEYWWHIRDYGWMTHDYVMCATPEEMRAWLYPPSCK